MKLLLETFVKAILAGLMIGIGGTVFLSVENRYLGALLFSIGLFTILRYGLALYTGKVGYIPENPPAYLVEVGVTFAGNAIGTGITALFLRVTQIGMGVHERAAAVMSAKLDQPFLSRLLLELFCGVMMFIAVDNGKRCHAEKRDGSFLFGTVMPVVVFILCGFHHSVADTFYAFAAIHQATEIPDGLGYLLTVALGNALGGMLLPLGMRWMTGTDIKAGS